MYVRIVRFESASDDWDERIADIRQQMEEGRSTELGQYVKRGLMLVDRANGRAVTPVASPVASPVSAPS